MSEFPGGRDPLDDFWIRFFVTARFRALFSMLFGVGVALQIQRAAEKGVPFLGTFTRRMVILAAFGMVNFLFYRGDILTRYALLGMILVPFYRLPVRGIASAAILVMAVAALTPLAVEAIPGARDGIGLVRNGLSYLPPSSETCRELRIRLAEGAKNYYALGSFREVRAIEACRFPGEATGWLYGRIQAILAVFLVGLAFGKARFFRRIEELLPRIRRGTLTAAIMGFGILALLRLSPEDPGPWAEAGLSFLRQSGVILTALTYAGILVLLFRTRPGHRVLSPLAALGRMALTVYIGQHVLAATLFQGWGLFWTNRPGLAALVMLAAIIYLTEVLLCNAWLHYFRFGPLEWLWRSLTYGKPQPMRRTAGL